MNWDKNVWVGVFYTSLPPHPFLFTFPQWLCSPMKVTLAISVDTSCLGHGSSAHMASQLLPRGEQSLEAHFNSSGSLLNCKSCQSLPCPLDEFFKDTVAWSYCQTSRIASSRMSSLSDLSVVPPAVWSGRYSPEKDTEAAPVAQGSDRVSCIQTEDLQAWRQ